VKPCWRKRPTASFTIAAWVRLAANTKFEQQHLLKRVRDALFKAQ